MGQYKRTAHRRRENKFIEKLFVINTRLKKTVWKIWCYIDISYDIMIKMGQYKRTARK